jgi:hypothetical protein
MARISRKKSRRTKMSNGGSSSNTSNATQGWTNSTSGNVVFTSTGSNSTAIGNNAGWYVSPTTTTGTGSIAIGSGYSYPNSGTISIGGSTVINYKPDHYYIMKLPEEVKKKMPESVYINGMLASLGMFGSDVDVAYTGQDLIFQSGVLRALTFNNKIRIAIYYKKKIYHFKCVPDPYGGVATMSENSNVINTELLSTIER